MVLAHAVVVFGGGGAGVAFFADDVFAVGDAAVEDTILFVSYLFIKKKEREMAYA